MSKVPEAVSDLTELEELDLPDNYLEELPTSINKLKNLMRLTSEVNQLRELPQAIAELSNLTVLSVNNNQLSVLPSNIKHLKNLWRLYLSSNQLAALPDEIGELKELEWLNEKMETGDYSSKYKNQLTTLPDEIDELKKLKVLLVAGNPVTLEEMVQVMKYRRFQATPMKQRFFFTCPPLPPQDSHENTDASKENLNVAKCNLG